MIISKRLVSIFAEAERVTKENATLWAVIGDTHNHERYGNDNNDEHGSSNSTVIVLSF